uniref:Uncharacterized protein n=1 Tax=Ditylenchus dipsaci TaxID=166011 RepID=A0A915ELI3_9BILA
MTENAYLHFHIWLRLEIDECPAHFCKCLAKFLRRVEKYALSITHKICWQLPYFSNERHVLYILIDEGHP